VMWSPWEIRFVHRPFRRVSLCVKLSGTFF